MASNATQLGLGALAAAVVGVAVIAIVPNPEQDAADDAVALVDDATPEDVAGPAQDAPEIEATPEDDAPESADVDVAAEIAPTFDTFRVEPDGSAIVAGRAAPGQTVDVVVAGTSLMQVQADANGSFVALFAIDASDAPRTLRLIGDPDGAKVASAETVMVAPFGMEPDAPAEETSIVVAGAVTAEPKSEANNTAAEQVTATAETPVEEDEADAAPVETTEAAAENTEPEVIVAEADTPEPETDDTAEPVAEPTEEVAPAAVAEATPDAPVEEATELALSAAGNGSETTTSEDIAAVEDVKEAAPETDEVATAVVETEAVTPVEVATVEPEIVETDMLEATPEVPADAPVSPTTLIADEDGVRVLAAPEVMTAVALDTITYDPAGEVVLAGRAKADGFVQVYIDNQPITTSRITEGGNWRTDLPQVDTGVYTLRIDEVDAEGTVVSRIETPFKREEPAAVAAVMAEETAKEGFEVAVRTVQPGSTLWAIAQEEMGEGIMYVAVFEANRDLIQDPDLIYPGQVFRIPQAAE